MKLTWTGKVHRLLRDAATHCAIVTKRENATNEFGGSETPTNSVRRHRLIEWESLGASQIPIRQASPPRTAEPNPWENVLVLAILEKPFPINFRDGKLITVTSIINNYFATASRYIYICIISTILMTENKIITNYIANVASSEIV